MLSRSYRDLIVWQKALDLVDDVYKLTSTFPNEESFGLTAQFRRCAVSVPSNIAEGQGRNSSKDFIRFLRISLGSLSELDTQIEIALRQNLTREAESIFERVTEIRTMIFGLMKSMDNG